MTHSSVFVHAVGTAVPPKRYSQEEIRRFFVTQFGDTTDKSKFIDDVFRGSSIDTRYLVVEDIHPHASEYNFFSKNGFLSDAPTTKTRNDRYIAAANELTLAAVQNLLVQLEGFDTALITHVITVSCTGFSAPGTDFYIVRDMGLSPYVHRFNIGFMGCYAAFPALKLARAICLSDPRARVLVVNVELSSLHVQNYFDREQLVSSALFADGCSAALVSSEPSDSATSRIALHDFASNYVERSEEAMTWTIGDYGFHLRLAPDIPDYLGKNAKAIIDRTLDRMGLEMSDIDIWAIHPGGKKILEAIAGSLELPASSLGVSYDVLREFGNMSSATVMFMLRRILESDRRGNIFSAGFGPGLTVETAHFEKV